MTIQILLISHIILAISIIFLVLINKGKGSEIGATFSNEQKNLLGSQESNSLIKKIITICSIIFIFSCISITILNNKKSNIENTSIIESSDYEYISDKILNK